MVTDETRRPDPLPAIDALPVGLGVIFRHYGATDRAALASRVAKVARQGRLTLLIASDWRLAARVGAAGIHLPEGLLRSGRLAPLLGWARKRNRIVTAACHNQPALATARRLGVNAALLSPVFATASHPGGRALGRIRFAVMSRKAEIPVYAFGGISFKTAKSIPGTGAIGLAAVGALTTG